MQIDKDIPFPMTFKSGCWGHYKGYDFGKLDVGDSILINDINHKYIRSKLGYIKYRTHREFVTKKEGEEIRVWRIK